MKTESIIIRPVKVLNRALLYIEKRSSLAATSLLVAVLLLGCAILYVGFAQLPVYHGVYYARLASDPFEPGNPNAYRILTPLAAYLLGLRGDRIIIFNAIAALLLLALVYYHSRKSEYSPGLSLAVALMLALTMPTLFTLFYGGYTDSTSYLLIFLMMVCRERPAWFWLLFFLGLLNRESVVFLLPFFLLLHWHSLKSRRLFVRSVLAGLGGVVLAYLLFRALINSHGAVKNNASFYLEPLIRDPLYWLRQVADSYPQGFFSVFKLFWLLPLVAAVLALRRRNYMALALVLTPVLCAMAQSVIALDTSRMIAMAFPTLLVGVCVVRKKVGDDLLSAAVILLGLVNLLVPQYYVTSNDVFLMR
ncbi:MAG TPA: hypothetical protein VJT09_12795 [Pyrinomonadaceae bacterium]|nr:hypothetical protein [Pyrinomonadaceae bacterium]